MKHRTRIFATAVLLAGAAFAPPVYAIDDTAPPSAGAAAPSPGAAAPSPGAVAPSPGAVAPSPGAVAPGPKVAASRTKQSVIRLDETVISGNEELPKVLYIVPWQDPSGMPNIEISPEFTESQVFRRLYPPAYRRELQYYDLLEANKTEE